MADPNSQPDIISIHAPHTRSDCRKWCKVTRAWKDFNPRPSYEERHDTLHIIQRGQEPFQSTPLIRGATRASDYNID
ncbi:MAG: hypothetical protein ACFWT1_03370 [Selenomonas sp.]